MRFRIELFLILIATLVFSQGSLMEFFRGIAGKRDFIIEGTIRFHVKDESGEFHDFVISGKLIVGNLENVCLYLKGPEMLSGLSFAYLEKLRRLYSGYEGKIDMNVVSVEENIIENFFLAFVDIITSPFFNYSMGRKNGEEVYTFFPGPREFLRRVGIEPITIEITFKEGSIKNIKIYGNDESENVELSIEKFEVGVDTWKYFSLGERGYPSCLIRSGFE